MVEGARLESEAGERHQGPPKHANAHAISDLTFPNYTRCASVNLDVLRGFEPDVSQSYHNRTVDLGACSTAAQCHRWTPTHQPDPVTNLMAEYN